MSLESLLQDARSGIRAWRFQPVIFTVAVTALALGIGANTTIFSVVDAVLLRPLPYRDPSRLVEIFEKAPKKSVAHYFLSSSDFFDFAERSRTLEQFAGYWRNEVNLTGDGLDPERIPAVSGTRELLGTLGIQPILGRDLTPDDQRDDAPEVALITSELWRSRFAADPVVIAKSIGLDGQSVRIIGVLPAGIHFAGDAQIWRDFHPYRPRPTPRFMEALARLRPGVSIAQAQAQMDSVARAIAAEFPATNLDWEAGLRTLPDQLFGSVRPALMVFLVSVGLLLLMACANVANLLLAQAATRQREVAVRAALGATAGRLARLFLIESVMLGLAGGGAGLFVAFAGVRAVRAFGPSGIPRLSQVELNQPVLLFTLFLSIATGIVFGIAPVLRIRRPELATALRESGRGSHGSAGEQRGRNALVIAQVSLAVVLVSTAGLLIKSFSRLMSVNPGFHADRVLTANISLSHGGRADGRAILNSYDRILAGVRTIPGIRAVGTTTSLPLAQDLDYRVPFRFLSLPSPRSLEDQTAWHRMVSAGLFRALGTPLLAGRDFDDHDGPDAPPVVIINQALARQYWPQGDPIGQKIRGASGGFGPLGTILVKDPQVIGIVADIKYSGLGKTAEPALYFSSRQAPFNNVTLVLRTDVALDTASLASALRQELHRVDPNLPLAHVRAMTEQVSEAVEQPHFQAILLGAFSALALILGSVGIYGVLSYSVARRTREIGITALGGRPRDIQRMILAQGLRLVATGVVVGLALSVAAGRLLTALLYEVKPIDLANYAIVCGILAAVGLLAGYFPARSASRIDPNTALR
jgi:putative ABC transport system permease protein